MNIKKMINKIDRIKNPKEKKREFINLSDRFFRYAERELEKARQEIKEKQSP